MIATRFGIVVLVGALLASAGCARSESAREASFAADATVAEEQRDADAASRREAGVRKVAERARAAAARDVERSAAPDPDRRDGGEADGDSDR